MTDLAIFDIDGTLTTFQDEEEECFNKTVLDIFSVSDFSRDWGSYKNVTYSGFVIEIMQKQLDRSPSETEFEKFEDAFIKLYGPIVRAGNPIKREILGANEMLTQLREIENLQLAIATGNWRRVAELKLGGARVDITGIPMATSNDALSREDIMISAYQMAADLNGGQSFEKVTYVGDGEWDAKASKNLNYDFIGITTKISKEVFDKYGAKAVFKDYSDPAAFLEALLK